ncbi:MAG: SAM-dependent methyltransferase [Anaerolineae bacterium]|nr:SAM-dependent methyltransferase [Anaerolineae bacterium]
MSVQPFQLSVIGSVNASAAGFILQIEAPYRSALQGLPGFSHINVIWWSHFLDRPDLRSQLVCQKPYKSAPETLGIFATRSPMRPNPLCLSVAQVINVDVPAGVIQLAYIDAEDGTPLLDIKPYLGCSDRVRQSSQPAWSSHWPEYYEDSAAFDWQSEFVNAQ